MDARALVYLRLCLGVHILMDINTRLDAGGLAFYVSEPKEEAALHPNDTPHKHFLHNIWFARGSATFQTAFFAILALTTIAYALGYAVHAPSRKLALNTQTVLYFLLTSMHGRCETVNDGSDRFLRNIVAWTACLPLDGTTQPCTLASLGITLQLTLMYWLTLASRYHGTMWWLPELSAVHYATAGTFATRAPALACALPTWLKQCMTACAVATEAVAPAAILMMPSCKGYLRAIPVLAIAGLHVGIAVLIRLVNWQRLGALVMVAWLPSGVLDLLPNPAAPHKATVRRKQSHSTSPITSAPSCSSILPSLLLTYMLYISACEFTGMPKFLDDGNVGEAVRFSQNWVMYSADPGKIGGWWTITAELQAHHVLGGELHGNLLGTSQRRHIDVLAAMRDGDWHHPLLDDSEVGALLDYVPESPSALYPNMRFERALGRWGMGDVAIREHTVVQKLGWLGAHLCERTKRERDKRMWAPRRAGVAQSGDFTTGGGRPSRVRFAYRELIVEPPGSSECLTRRGLPPLPRPANATISLSLEDAYLGYKSASNSARHVGHDLDVVVSCTE